MPLLEILGIILFLIISIYYAINKLLEHIETKMFWLTRMSKKKSQDEVSYRDANSVWKDLRGD